MATLVVGQPPTMEFRSAVTPMGVKVVPKMSYIDTIKPPNPQYKSILLKQVEHLHGEPRIVWEEDEINQMIINKDLQYAVIGNFSYRCSGIQDLRKLIPKQYELKGEVNIGILINHYILISATRLDDYVHLYQNFNFTLP